jgi:hypothetical protein
LNSSETTGAGNRPTNTQEEIKMTATMRAEIEELARQIKKSDTWDMDQLAELCEAAGMAEEWKNADGDTFEQVALTAAEKLGVEII